MIMVVVMAILISWRDDDESGSDDNAEVQMNSFSSLDKLQSNVMLHFS